MPETATETTGAQSATTKPPLVSVVIPAYNAAGYISATLNSVLNQSFRDFEIIVINDGSPDTIALERALEPYHSRVRYITQQNAGPSAARNVGIRQGRGKYVAFLDSDDLWLPDHLGSQVAALQTDPSLGLIYANSLHIVNNQPEGNSFDRTPQSEPVTFESLVREDCTVGTSTTVAERKAVLDAGLFDENLRRCEDFDLWLRMAHNGVRMTFTRTIQVYHRLANGLAADSELMKDARLRVVQKMDNSGILTEQQRVIVRRRIQQLEFDLELNRAKTFLLNGNSREARQAASRAARACSQWKVRLLQVGLYFFPGALRSIYRLHRKRIAGRNSNRPVASTQEFVKTGQVDLGIRTPQPSNSASPNEQNAQ